MHVMGVSCQLSLKLSRLKTQHLKVLSYLSKIYLDLTLEKVLKWPDLVTKGAFMFIDYQ